MKWFYSSVTGQSEVVYMTGYDRFLTD